MIQGYIYMQRWLAINNHSKESPTDRWYVEYAKKLLPIIEQSPIYYKKSIQERTEAAIVCAIYFQDAIAQSGGWKDFTDRCYEHYKTYLPFYTLTDSYIPDEVNPEDIAIVLWFVLSQIPIDINHRAYIQDPFDPDLLLLSQKIYKQLDQDFEKAPIDDTLALDTWPMELFIMDIPITPLTEIKPDTILSQDAARCLEYSGGEPLLYFPTYRELKKFLLETLKWDNKKNNLLSEMQDLENFVVYANAKGMLLAPEVSFCFKDPRNKTYDPARAEFEGYLIFCQPSACPFDLIKYGMYHNLLPDISLPFPNGKEVLHKHWDFITRFFLFEYYEAR